MHVPSAYHSCHYCTGGVYVMLGYWIIAFLMVVCIGLLKGFLVALAVGLLVLGFATAIEVWKNEL